MRVCIIGNSHLAALRKAFDPWRREHGAAGLDFTFFGSHSGSLRLVEARDGRLTTSDPAVRRTLQMTTGRDDPDLPIGEFDAYVLYGLLNPNWYVAQHVRHGLDRPAHLPRVSRGLLREVAAKAFRSSLAQHVLSLVRTASDAPVVLAPQPYLSQNVVHDPNHSPYGDQPPADLAPRPALLQALDGIVADKVAAGEFRWLPQPAATIVDDHWTRPEYCVDSVRLTAKMDRGHPDDDYAHMNHRYGELVLHALPAALAPLATAARARAVDAA